MTLASYTLVVPVDAAGCRLDTYLASTLDGVSRKAVKKSLDAGRVFVDGRVERRAGTQLTGGETLQVAVVASAVSGEKSLLRLEVLYRDESLLAVDKPAGWPVHKDAEGRVNILDGITRQLGLAKPPILLHRLDVDTTGVLLFALDDAANRHLSRQFAEHSLQKTYLALVSGHPPASLHVHDRLRAGVRGRTVRVESGGQEAETRVRTLATGDSFSLVRAEPSTGRTHQIRAHLAAEGYPLLGDRLYGGPAWVAVDGKRLVAGRYLLHACRLELEHPSGERLGIAAPLPDDFQSFIAYLDGSIDLP